MFHGVGTCLAVTALYSNQVHLDLIAKSIYQFLIAVFSRAQRLYCASSTHNTSAMKYHHPHIHALSQLLVICFRWLGIRQRSYLLSGQVCSISSPFI